MLALGLFPDFGLRLTILASIKWRTERKGHDSEEYLDKVKAVK